MSPLQKTEHLFNTFYDLEGKAISKIDAFKLSIICVEEIIKALKLAEITENSKDFIYWSKILTHLKNKEV